MENINWEKCPYDFIDFGSKSGGSMKLAMKRFGGRRGLGIDINPECAQKAQEAGYDVICGDATNLASIPDKAFNFSMLSHFLEHLPDITHAEKSIASAIRISKKFVYIRGPVFDYDDYLKEKNLKFFWSDWTGHPCHLTTTMLMSIINKFDVKSVKLKFEVPIKNSTNENVHPLLSPADQHEYDEKIHPKKDLVIFDKDLYREFECLITLKNDNFIKKLFKKIHG